MPEIILSDYFYGDESEEFIYFKIPRLLITDQKFKHVSTDAKRLYTNATEITQRMVAKLIDHIDVYHTEKKVGVTTQRSAYFLTVPNCIGEFAVPDRRNIPGCGDHHGDEKGSSRQLFPGADRLILIWFWTIKMRSALHGKLKSHKGLRRQGRTL